MKNHIFTFGLISLFCLAFLDCFSVPPIPPVQRPNYNTGIGFFVKNGKLYDANGYEFVIRGINHVGWAANINQTLSSNYGLVRSGSNAVRLAVNRQTDNFGICTPTQKRDAVKALIEKRLVPIIETHFYYEDEAKMALFRRSPDSLKTIIEDWLKPDNVSWLKEYEKQVILNITNEWGVDFTTWKSANIEAIKRLRDAGIKCSIMVDAGGDFGQNPNSLMSGAQEILNRDSQKNIIFSLHMYGYWVTNDSPIAYRNEINHWGGSADTPCTSPNCAAWDLAPQLTRLQNLNNPRIAIVIGEISWEGATGEVAYKTRRLMAVLRQRGIGWLAWSWNQNRNSGFDMLKKDANNNPLWLYRHNIDLTPFGNLIINDPQLGLRATARRPNIF